MKLLRRMMLLVLKRFVMIKRLYDIYSQAQGPFSNRSVVPWQKHRKGSGPGTPRSGKSTA
jgi:hypothetical protein